MLFYFDATIRYFSEGNNAALSLGYQSIATKPRGTSYQMIYVKLGVVKSNPYIKKQFFRT